MYRQPVIDGSREKTAIKQKCYLIIVKEVHKQYREVSMINTINSSTASISSSYADALKQMSASLARLGSGKRFQTASEDLGSYLKVNSIQTSRNLMESSQNSIKEAKGFLEVASGYASTLLDNLESLKDAAYDYFSAAAGSAEQEAAEREFDGIRASLDEILDTEYDGDDLNIAADKTFQTVRLANGGSLAISFAVADDAVTYASTDLLASYALTATALDGQIDKVASFAGKVGGYLAQVESQETFVNTMIQNLEAAESSITEINEAAEMARYTENDIRQQVAVAMMAQANMSRHGILNLYK